MNKLAEVDRQRDRAQDLAIQGLLDADELRAKLAGLRETREAAQRELSACRNRLERVEMLERERDHVLRLIRQPLQHAPDSVVYALEETELLKRLGHDPDAAAEHMARGALRVFPHAVAEMSPENRHRLYKARRVRAVAVPGGSLEVSFDGTVGFLESETVSWHR